MPLHDATIGDQDSTSSSPHNCVPVNSPKSSMVLEDDSDVVETSDASIKQNDDCKGDFLSMLEKSLALRLETFGEEHEECIKAWLQLCMEYNLVAMKQLQHDLVESALEYLTRGYSIVSSGPCSTFAPKDERFKLLAITHNNFSCVLKRKGLLKIALRHAEKALLIESKSCKMDNPAVTHLNMCAILSRLGRHEHALEHCECALQLINKGYFKSDGIYSEYLVATENPQKSLESVCLFNMAVEQEYLKNYSTAIESYRRAMECATQLSPENINAAEIVSACSTAISSLSNTEMVLTVSTLFI